MWPVEHVSDSLHCVLPHVHQALGIAQGIDQGFGESIGIVFVGEHAGDLMINNVGQRPIAPVGGGATVRGRFNVDQSP